MKPMGKAQYIMIALLIVPFTLYGLAFWLDWKVALLTHTGAGMMLILDYHWKRFK